MNTGNISNFSILNVTLIFIVGVKGLRTVELFRIWHRSQWPTIFTGFYGVQRDQRSAIARCQWVLQECAKYHR